MPDLERTDWYGDDTNKSVDISKVLPGGILAGSKPENSTHKKTEISVEELASIIQSAILSSQ